jgi:hypothetical protein
LRTGAIRSAYRCATGSSPAITICRRNILVWGEIQVRVAARLKTATEPMTRGDRAGTRARRSRRATQHQNGRSRSDAAFRAGRRGERMRERARGRGRGERRRARAAGVRVGGGAAAAADLEPNLVEPEQAEREPAEEAREADQHEDRRVHQNRRHCVRGRTRAADGGRTSARLRRGETRSVRRRDAWERPFGATSRTPNARAGARLETADHETRGLGSRSALTCKGRRRRFTRRAFRTNGIIGGIRGQSATEAKDANQTPEYVHWPSALPNQEQPVPAIIIREIQSVRVFLLFFASLDHF